MNRFRPPGAGSSDSSGGAGKDARLTELAARVASALVLAAAAIAATWHGGWPFAVLWSLASGVIVFEWLGLGLTAVRANRNGGVSPVGGFPFVARLLISAGTGALPLLLFLDMLPGAFVGTAMVMAVALGWCVLVARGAAVISLAAWALTGIAVGALIGLTPVLARAVPGIGSALIAWMFAVTWTTDIAAYFSGRAIGGPRLWPRVSPNKTWAGCVGGTLAGTFMGWLVAHVAATAGAATAWDGATIAAISALASLAGQAGDLAESAIKRRAGVKDSGRLIPGHGGFMDRLDGFAANCLLVAIGLAAGVFAPS